MNWEEEKIATKKKEEFLSLPLHKLVENVSIGVLFDRFLFWILH